MKKKPVILTSILLLTLAMLASLPYGESTFGTGFFVDDFNAPLNLSVWKVANYSTNYAYLLPACVSVSDSQLHIVVLGGQRIGGQIGTIARYSHGLFGSRLRANQNPTSVCGIFTYFKDSTMGGCDQIALEIFGNNPTKLSFGQWKSGKKDRVFINLGYDATTSFHDYEFAWYTNHTDCYVDGALVASLTDPTCVPTHAQNLFLSSFSWSGFLEAPSSVTGQADFAEVHADILPSSSSTTKVLSSDVISSTQALSLATVDGMINPSDGQNADYNISKYYTNGKIIYTGWWNMTYTNNNDTFVNVSHTISRPACYGSGTFTLLVDKTNRWVADGTSWWCRSSYIGWIDPNITPGSTIKWWMSKATVVGSETIKDVDTWKLDATVADENFKVFAYYDKNTGLLIKLVDQGNDVTQSLELCSTSYNLTNTVPIVTITSPVAGVAWSGTRTITWTGSDNDYDTVTYDVYPSIDGGTNWFLLTTVSFSENPTAATHVTQLDTTQYLDSSNCIIKINYNYNWQGGGGTGTISSSMFTIDNTVPVTGIVHFAGSADISLIANDTTSGVCATYYRIDGGAWNQYTSTFTLSPGTTHLLESYSSDNAGNTGPTVNLTVDYLITSTNCGSVSPISGWYDSGSTFTISSTASDSYIWNGWTGSGPGSYTGTNNPATITTNGLVSEIASWTTPQPLGSLSGTVTDSQTNAPISGAIVSYTGPTSGSATTDSNGYYIANNLVPGSCTITVSVVNYNSQTQTATVSSGCTTTLDFQLQPLLGSITGRVTDEMNGNGISGAMISYSGPNSATVPSDSDGFYTIQNLPSGSYQVTASMSGYTTSSPTLESVPSGGSATVNFHLQPLLGSINGRVTDSLTGNNISGAMVSYSGPSSGLVSTDSSGLYIIPYLSEGTYQLTAQESGSYQTSATTSTTVPPNGLATVNFQLQPLNGSIIGRVTDYSNGNGILGAVVSCSGPTAASATTDSNGYYTIANLLPGSYEVNASKSGFATSPPINASVPDEGSATANFQLQLSLGSINGEVTDASNGTSVLNAIVWYSGPMIGSVSTDANGYYDIPNLTPGSYSLNTSKSGYIASSNITTSVPAGGSVTVDFQLQPLPPPYGFADGFESGNFNAWNGVRVSTGETASIVNSVSYSGNYSARFTSNGNSTYENAYVYKTLTSTTELYSRGYFYVSQSGIVSNGNRFYLIMLNAGSNNVAYVGWRMTGGVLQWNLVVRDGTGYLGNYSAPSPVLNQWYCVELHWNLGATNGLGELYLNGVLVCSITGRNTTAFGQATSVLFGIASAYSCTGTIVYTDSCVISKTYSGPITVVPAYVHCESKQDSGASTSLGSMSLDAINYTLPYDLAKPLGTYSLTYDPAVGYSFDHWVTSGAVTVQNSNSQSTSVTIIGNGIIQAVYKNLLFADDFESGSFSAWSGSSKTTGETALVVNALTHHGVDSAQFTSDGSSAYESVYCYQTLSALSEVYARGYFQVTQSGIVQTGNRFYFIQFKAGSNSVAWAGWRQTSNGLKWELMIRSGTSYVSAYSSSAPALNGWYCVELHWKKGASGGADLWIDGVPTCSLAGKDTTAYGDVNKLCFGLPELESCGATTVYCDCCVINTTYIGKET